MYQTRGVPCRPQMTGCLSSCGHRRSVEDYRLAREADLQAAEYATAGYATELAEYLERNPPMDFHTWLKGRRR